MDRLNKQGIHLFLSALVRLVSPVLFPLVESFGLYNKDSKERRNGCYIVSVKNYNIHTQVMHRQTQVMPDISAGHFSPYIARIRILTTS